MLSEIGVGIIGAGLMGFRHGKAINAIRGARVTAVTDVIFERSQELANKLGAKAIKSIDDLLRLKDVNAVIITVPDNNHLNPTLQAIESQKHILLEKPLATSIDEGTRIIQAVQSGSDRVFMVGHLLRFDPRFVGAAQAVADGKIGEILSISLRRNSSISGPERYQDRARLHFHVSVHDADLLRFVTSLEVKQVYAQAIQRVLDGENRYDSLLAIINLSSGALCQMEACWVLPPTYSSALDGFMEVVGTRGVIYVDTLHQGLTIVDYDGFKFPDTMRYWEQDRKGYGLVHNQAQHFIECIDNHEQPLVDVYDGFEAIRICQALIDSIELGRPTVLGE